MKCLEIELRLSKAEMLLLSADLAITDIAVQTGFNSTVSFTQNFKEKYRITPSGYRARYTKTV